MTKKSKDMRMYDISEELKDAFRSSRLLNFILTQKRKLKNTKITSSSTIVFSKIPGLYALGEHSLIKGSTVSGDVDIGEQCAILKTAISGKVTIGDYTTVNSETKIIGGAAGVSIGKFCSVAPRCYFQTYNHDIRSLASYNMHKNVFSRGGEPNKIREGDNNKDSVSKGGIRIGNDVWIGTNSTILSGVSIGDGAVVGANALVNKNVPPYAIVGGTPARNLGYRFTSEIIEELLKTKWWDWPLDQLLRSEHLFSGFFDSLELEDLETPKVT